MAKRVFKTKKKLSGGGKLAFRKWDEWTEGDRIVARLKGWRTDRYDKECPTVEIIEADLSDKKAQKAWPEGTLVSLNAAGMLNKALKELNEGDLFQLVYNGTNVIEKGTHKGKESHTFEIDEIEDPENPSKDEDEETDEDEEEEYEEEDSDEGDFDL